MTEHRLFLAGGFIRSVISGEQPSDIDLFGGIGDDDMSNLANEIVKGRTGALSSATENAITVVTVGRIPIQLITRWCFDDAAELAEHFDFTIAQSVIWHESGDTPKWRGLCSPDFYADLAAKRLAYTSPPDSDVGGSVLRMVKMLRRGYRISPESIGKLLAQLIIRVDAAKLNLGNIDGVAAVIVGLLREVDPLSVVDGTDLIDSEPQGQGT